MYFQLKIPSLIEKFVQSITRWPYSDFLNKGCDFDVKVLFNYYSSRMVIKHILAPKLSFPNNNVKRFFDVHLATYVALT